VTITCAACGASGEPVRVVYGDPIPETVERARRGEIVLGGCTVTGDDPQWACSSCSEPVAIPVAVRATSRDRSKDR